MTLKFVVLGLLDERPMHGYEIKRAISPVVAPAGTVNDGVIYPLLRKLEKEGLIAGRTERGGKAPPRKVFKPTKRGSEEFANWLRSENDEQDEVDYDFLLQHPFLVKFQFFAKLDAGMGAQKLDRQLESSSLKLRRFGEIRRVMTESGIAANRIAVLDLAIAQQRAKVQWLKKRIAAAGKEGRSNTKPASRVRQKKGA